MRHWRRWIAGILALIVVLFALQNLDKVQPSFLFWTFETRLYVIVGLAFVIGFIAAWVLKNVRRARQQAAERRGDARAEPIAPTNRIEPTQ